MSNTEQLIEWLEELVFRDNDFDEVIKIVRKDKVEAIVRLYTRTNRYSITCIESSRSDWEGYLGCTVIDRKPRAGENWRRSRDLSDGEFNRETWESIKNDIISHELVRIAKNQRSNRADII